MTLPPRSPPFHLPSQHFGLCASFSGRPGTEAEPSWLGFIILEIRQRQIFTWEEDPDRTHASSWKQGEVAADPLGPHASGPR